MKEVHEMDFAELEAELKLYDIIFADLVISLPNMFDWNAERSMSYVRACLYKKRKSLTIFQHIYLRICGIY